MLGGMDHVLAVDIGGTKLAAGLVDEDGRLSAGARTPTRGDGPDGLFATLTGLIDRVLGSAGGIVPVACGIGTGGPMTGAGRAVSPLNIPQWRVFPLLERVGEHVGLPTWVDNDAKALALGEGWRGAAREERNFVAMVVSTGVGGGIVLDGRLLDGDDGNAGHIGHVIAVPDGRECRCGARGCLEAEASGSAIGAVTGRPAREADAATRERTGTLVGRVVASVANLLDLQVACVAGSVALGFGDAFFNAAQAEVDRSARLDHSRGARVVPGGLGADGPLIGAGAVAWRGMGRKVLA